MCTAVSHTLPPLHPPIFCPLPSYVRSGRQLRFTVQPGRNLDVTDAVCAVTEAVWLVCWLQTDWRSALQNNCWRLSAMFSLRQEITTR